MNVGEFLSIALQFLVSWWGLVFVLLLLAALLIFDFQRLKSMVVWLIFIAEERARAYALETGKDKFEWVVQHGYAYVPVWLKLFITEAVFRAIVQSVFDKLISWAENQELRRPRIQLFQRE